MYYNEHNPTNEFLDSLTSNSFIPLILQSTRITIEKLWGGYTEN